MGDVNIDILKKDSDELKSLISSNSFHILNDTYTGSFTRRDLTSSSIIDHMYIDISGKFFLQLGESGLSDHRFMSLIMQTTKKNTARVENSKKVCRLQ
jgi:hypothetical protein